MLGAKGCLTLNTKETMSDESTGKRANFLVLIVLRHGMIQLHPGTFRKDDAPGIEELLPRST